MVGPANKSGLLTATDRKSSYRMASSVSSKGDSKTLAKLLGFMIGHRF
jgi:hypothetical protein